MAWLSYPINLKHNKHKINKGVFIYKPIQIPVAKGFNLVCENLVFDSQAGVSRLYYFNEEKKNCIEINHKKSKLYQIFISLNAFKWHSTPIYIIL